MNIVPFSTEIVDDINGMEMLKKIERAGRTCYKSEDKITDTSAVTFVRGIIKRGHETVIEHEKVTVRVICDRGVTHEIVRHRIASYSQESTRYVNYMKKPMEFIGILEHLKNPLSEDVWIQHMEACEKTYNKLIELGETPQIARSVLPNSLKTEIVMTMNLREWRHFFKLRSSSAAHPQMIEVANDILVKFRKLIPVIFDELWVV